MQKPKNDDKEFLSPLRESLGLCKKAFVHVGVFSFFINLLMLVPAIYMLQVYDRALGSRSVETLIMLSIILVVLFVTMGLLQMVRSGVLIRIGNKLDLNLNQRIFGAMFSQAVERPSKQSSQPLTDLTTLRQYLTGQGPIAFFDGPWLPIFVAILFLFHPWFGYFAVFSAIILVVLAYANEKLTAELLGEANSKNVVSNQYAGSALRNAEVVHAMGMEGNLRSKWMEKHLSFLENQSKASDRAAVTSNLSKALRMLFQSLMLGLGAYLAIIQEITPGMVIAGSILLGRALAPLDIMIGSWKGLASARSSWNRLNELLEGYEQKKETMPLPPPVGHVSAENVFAIPPGSNTPALRGINFQLLAGEMLAVVGPSAAGKSSLARVLLGVWPLANGSIRLDGADIHQWNKAELGPHVGYLPQDIELFEGTVSQNIARFSEPDPRQVVEAAKLAGVHELILRLPEGYDTPISTVGGVLSGGQRQRVGLARAVYGNPKFIVLDEPNSNLDDQGEQALVAALESLKEKGVTVVLISHKKPILRLVHKMLVLSEGVQIAFGSRDDVMRGLQDGSISISNNRSQQLEKKG